MHELKLFILRLMVAAFLVAFCLTVSRATQMAPQSKIGEPLAACSIALHEGMTTSGKVIAAGVSYSHMTGECSQD